MGKTLEKLTTLSKMAGIPKGLMSIGRTPKHSSMGAMRYAKNRIASNEAGKSIGKSKHPISKGSWDMEDAKDLKSAGKEGLHRASEKFRNIHRSLVPDSSLENIHSRINKSKGLSSLGKREIEKRVSLAKDYRMQK